jgi:Ca2+-binding RTX toxin-like protein
MDFTLSDNVEELILAAKAISGTGNDLANTIVGNGSVNILDGRGDADILSGGRGDDVFVFRKGEANGDTIMDFAGNGARAGDSIQLVGYGAGTVIESAGGNTWVITDGLSQETIILANGASIDATDWVVIA